MRRVLGHKAFRRLWLALSLSSLGDWLGLLATQALALQLAAQDHASAAKSAFALGGVLIFRLMPAVVVGPFAGAVADRFDRRKTMVICDLLRCGLFISMPLVGKISYLLLASFAIETLSLFWIPAKEASVPNLVPLRELETANQLSLITTYGSAPVAALIFAGLSKLNDAVGLLSGFFDANPATLAIYFNAITFLVTAMIVASLREISTARPPQRDQTDERPPSLFADIAEGWRFLGSTPLLRGLVVGILGAFAAGGTIIALGRLYAVRVGGGDAAYGLLFGAVFAGLAGGMAVGPRLLSGFSRRRLFGLSIIAAGGFVIAQSVLPNLALALLCTTLVGAFAGVAWVTGYTMLGTEVGDDKRGRTFATVQSLVRIDLLAVLALAPLATGVVESYTPANGVVTTMLVAGVIAMLVGLYAYRQMDDGRVPLRVELARAFRRRAQLPEGLRGLLIAFEGGEGAGKSTQVQRLAEHLEGLGHDVVTTFEPGATKTGAAVRTLLLDRRTVLSPRAEALLYAADRAQHVADVVRPAMAAGGVVLTDRFVDSSVAYQGAGRELAGDEVARLSGWATDGLVADLVVLLDLPPEVGLGRLRGRRDRLEGEALEFHERVRQGFLTLARSGPARYVVIDARADAEAVAERVRAAIEERLGARLADLLVANVVAEADPEADADSDGHAVPAGAR